LAFTRFDRDYTVGLWAEYENNGGRDKPTTSAENLQMAAAKTVRMMDANW